MLLVVLGAAATAVLAACVAFIVQRTFRINARWLIPASAGAAMLGFTIYNDYTWFGRIAEALPPGVVVVATGVRAEAIQPWSLVAPIVVRFAAVDLNRLEVLEDAPSVRRAPVHLAARFQPTLTTRQLIDCARGLRADADGPDRDARGLPPEQEWVRLEPDDPLLLAVCGAPSPV